jgi:dihydrofolate reductase
LKRKNKELIVSAKIIATNYISLDGVIEDPVGMENSGLGNWTGPFTRGPIGDKFKEDELADSEAMIYGRRTYDGFAAVWPTVPGPFAERMNAMPKYLASHTIIAPAWNNTTAFGKDLIQEARELKSKYRGNILIYGSASVVHALMPHGLVDQFNLMVYPVLLGRGIKLFPEGFAAPMALKESQQFGNGIISLAYQRTSQT